MSEFLDIIFWYVGAGVSLVGITAMAAAVFVGLGYLAYSIVHAYRIAGFVKCHPLPAFDCAAYRAVFRFKHTVGFLFGGVPTEMSQRGFGTVFHVDWIKNGIPEDDGY